MAVFIVQIYSVTVWNRKTG